jgi:hypothetical protein
MTTRAQVRGIYSSDMDDLAQYLPSDPESFCVSVRAMVGPEAGKGEESFDINVCTPKWLAEVCRAKGFIVGRHYLIVDQYDVVYLRRLITKLVQECEGDSWRDVAEKVGRLGFWEFEDYKPAPERSVGDHS